MLQHPGMTLHTLFIFLEGQGDRLKNAAGKKESTQTAYMSFELFLYNCKAFHRPKSNSCPCKSHNRSRKETCSAYLSIAVATGLNPNAHPAPSKPKLIHTQTPCSTPRWHKKGCKRGLGAIVAKGITEIKRPIMITGLGLQISLSHLHDN